MIWEATIGPTDDEPYFHEVDENWAKLRIEMAKQIERYLTDECWDCRLDGTAAFNQLAALGYQRVFEAEIDGFTHRIAPRETS